MSAASDIVQYRSVGRTIGLLLLLLIVVAPLVNFVMLKPAFAPPGFLVNAAPHAFEVRLGALLNLALGALSLGMAITGLPVLRRHTPALAIWFLVLAAASFTLTAVDSAALLSALSLSQEHVQAGGADSAVFEGLRIVVAAERRWTHYIGLVLAGHMVTVLYAALYCSALVPRVLATVGIGSAVLQLCAVTMPIFGRPMIFPMLLPLGLTHLFLALWLLAKGFEVKP